MAKGRIEKGGSPVKLQVSKLAATQLKGASWLPWLGVLLTLLGLGAGVYFLLKKRKPKTPATSSGPKGSISPTLSTLGSPQATRLASPRNSLQSSEWLPYEATDGSGRTFYH